jgi:hypothetical protein
MDGVNIYLGVAVALFLGGVGIKALGVDPGEPRTKKVRGVLFVLAAGFAVAAYVVPLPGTAKYDRQQAQESYQRQVLAACAAYKTTFHTGDGALRVDDQGRYLREPMVTLLTGQVTADRATLSALWRKNPPAGLEEAAQRAHRLADRVLVAATKTIDQIRLLPPALSQDDLDSVTAANPDTGGLFAEFSSAMSELAGGECALR